jgi:hypothetical protein
VQIENLIGKTFVFQLELNDFNLLHGWQFFTVKTVFDSIVQSDNAFKLEKITEVSTFILHLIQIIHIFYLPYKYFDTLINIFLLTVLYEFCFK